jgi:putative membrane protein insertion efficiency factor
VIDPGADDCDHGHTYAEDCGRPATGVSRPLIAMVRWYQIARAGRPSPCRYVPSCSTYALEAFEHHGAVRGLWLSLRRLSRCHPWGGQGYDPVPLRTTCSPGSGRHLPTDQKVP